MKQYQAGLRKLLLFAGAAIMAVLISCTGGKPNEGLPGKWIWMDAGDRSVKEWKTVMQNLDRADIRGIFLRGTADDYRLVIPLAGKRGIEVHAWIITLNRAWDEEAKKHPEWFTISRNGASCFDVHPYVDYYMWVCPSREDVYSHIEQEVMSLLEIEGLAGVHLDYVRYSDVILPVGLWEKYNLIQDTELPEFDFCYCDSCRARFMKETGIDIRELQDPAASTEWREYRWNSVTRLVNRLAEKVHTEKPGRMLTAAVFPYPEISRTICRQDWARWNLDAFFPMIYHSFYNESVQWIGTATAKGVADLAGKAPEFSGLFIPELTAPELTEAVEVSLSNGAAGYCLFNYESMKEEHWKVLRAMK